MASTVENCVEGYDVSRFEVEVRPELLCGICKDVPKDPRLCNKDHLFCFAHISQHLETTPSCPVCIVHLTPETLRSPSGFLKIFWEDMKIKCNYDERGCPEYVRLENLQTHVDQCGFAPMICTNEGCGKEINRKDQDIHERNYCQFSITKCHDCNLIKESQEQNKAKLDEMKVKLNETKVHIADIELKQDKISEEMNPIKVTVDEMKQNQTEMKASQNEIKRNQDQINEKVNEITENGKEIIQAQAEVKGSHIKIEKKQDEINDKVDEIKGNIATLKQTQAEAKATRDKIKRTQDQIEEKIDQIKKNDTEKKQAQAEVKARQNDIKRKQDKVDDKVDQMKRNIDNLKQTQAEVKDLECQTKIERKQNQIQEKVDQIKKSIDELKKSQAEVKANKNEMKIKQDQIDDKVDQMKDSVDKMKQAQTEMKADQVALKAEVTQQFEQMKQMMKQILQNNIHGPQAIDPEVAVINKDIIIFGGYNAPVLDKALNTVETFSIVGGNPVQLPPMNHSRAQSASCVYNSDVIVAGGHDGKAGTDSIEILEMNQHPLRWRIFEGKLPAKLSGHSVMVYRETLIVTGGYNSTERKASDLMYELRLAPPYASKVLVRIPEPRRYHGTELVNGKLYILGGTRTTFGKEAIDSVLVYDFLSKVCKPCASLPRAVCGMSTVTWGNMIIVAGGVNRKNEVLNDVIVYDTESGRSDKLPSMIYKRRGSSAVIIDDDIVVFGGWNKEQGHLNSIERFTMGSDGWNELPLRMKEKRYYATAVVKPHN